MRRSLDSFPCDPCESGLQLVSSDKNNSDRPSPGPGSAGRQPDSRDSRWSPGSVVDKRVARISEWPG